MMQIVEQKDNVCGERWLKFTKPSFIKTLANPSAKYINVSHHTHTHTQLACVMAVAIKIKLAYIWAPSASRM